MIAASALFNQVVAVRAVKIALGFQSALWRSFWRSRNRSANICVMAGRLAWFCRSWDLA